MRLSALLDVFEKAVAPLRARVDLMISRVVLDAIKDGAKMQGLKVVALADEVLEDVEHFQPGGLSHVPVSGAEGVLLCVAGHRDHPIVICVSERESRPTGGSPGETVLYSTSSGTKGVRVRAKADGSVEITPYSGQVVKIIGDLEVTGEVHAKSDSTPVGLSTHQHPTAMGPSGPPTPGT